MQDCRGLNNVRSTNSTPVFKEEYQKQIADIYKQYQQTVKPYVAQLEVMENEYLNEKLNSSCGLSQ